MCGRTDPGNGPGTENAAFMELSLLRSSNRDGGSVRGVKKSPSEVDSSLPISSGGCIPELKTSGVGRGNGVWFGCIGVEKPEWFHV